MRTVADSVNCVPAAGSLSLTEGSATTKSGWACIGGTAGTAAGTLTGTAAEQLLVVSDSSVAVSTHAP